MIVWTLEKGFPYFSRTNFNKVFTNTANKSNYTVKNCCLYFKMQVIGSITKLNIILGKLIAAERLRDSITNLQGKNIREFNLRLQPWVLIAHKIKRA